MEKIIHKFVYQKLAFFLFLAGMLIFTAIGISPHNSFYIFIVEMILLSFFIAFRKEDKEILKDLLYIEYSKGNSTTKVSKKLGDLIEDKGSLLAGVIWLDGREAGSLKLALQEKTLDLEFYNGCIVNLNDICFKIFFIRLGKNLVRGYFTEVTEEIQQRDASLKAYRQLLEQYGLYTAILQNMAVPIIVRNRYMQIVFYNQAYSDLVTGDDTQPEADTLEMDPKLKKAAMDALSLSKPISIQESILLEDHKYLHEIKNIPVGQSDLVVSSIYDIRTTEKAQKDYNDLRQGIQNFLDTLPYACMVIDKEGSLKYYNLKFKEIWGFDTEFFIEGLTHTEILDHLYLKGKLPAQVDYSAFKGERLALHSLLETAKEDFFYLPDGTCIKAKSIPFDDISVLFTYEDITTNLNTTRSLKSADKIRDSIIYHARDGIVVFGTDGALSSINPHMMQMWDIGEENSQNLTIAQFMEKSFVGVDESEKAQIENAFSNALVSNVEVSQMIKGMNERTIHRRIFPLPYKGVMISDLDVTEEFNKIESYNAHILSLTALDRDKSKFLANMPNKMRGAINSIIGISHILLVDNVTNLTKEQSQHLNDLKKSADYIALLIKDSENYSDFVDVYDMPRAQEIDLMICFKNTMKFFQEDMGSKGIKCKFKHEISSMPCFIDPIKIQNALTAIMQNVIYRATTGTCIEIVVKAGKDKYYVAIKDDGIRYQNLKNKNNGFNYYNLSITYARMLLKSLDVDLLTAKEPGKNIFKFELINDRSLIEYH